MPNERDRIDTGSAGDASSSWMASLLAEEDAFDHRALWRLGTWAGSAVVALTVAVLAAQQSTDLRRERLAYADITRQAQQIQWIAKDSQNESRRLAAAVDTLNGDRDRLYSRVTVLEQGLESVTGSIPKQLAATVASPAALPPKPAPVATGDPAPLPDKKSAAATDVRPDQRPDAKTELSKIEPKAETAIPLTPAPVKPVLVKPQAKADTPADSKTEVKAEAKKTDAKTEVGTDGKPEMKPEDGKKDVPVVTSSITALPETQDLAAASQPVQRTDFGVDIGAANSVEGLRALWRGAVAAHRAILGDLQPIIVVKERNDGMGLQLRLVAGPIANAADAAKLCARLVAAKRGCETAVYDGQRLAMDNVAAKPVPAANAPKPVRRARPKPEETPPPQRGFMTIFNH